jgi:glycosyltransferase involved in cell wall biosynthesis
VISDGRDGFLVDHNDVPHLAQTVVRLVEMGEAARRDMGQRARQTVLGGYTWSQVARRLLSIYEEATARAANA